MAIKDNVTSISAAMLASGALLNFASIYFIGDKDLSEGNHRLWIAKYIVLALAQGLVTAGFVYLLSKPFENRLAKISLEQSLNQFIGEALVPIRSEVFKDAYYEYRCSIYIRSYDFAD
ncbi:hypothetical protein [Methylobacterium radiodurans]|uniref:hypothetical protein n=1 Tax=Methylobacterium radiodurans TaxID=2202828 RepID=UPI0013A5B2F4|nr:hypothetical protein [Methylobacterium radiodurans]